MDTNLNVTYIRLDGYVAMKRYRYVYFVVMFIVYVLILCSNFVIVFIVVVQKNLHEPMFIFIAALLLNSVFFSTVIYPKLLIDFLSERQIISQWACNFQSFMFYSLGGSEFLLLAAMAYDRYVSICKPLQYPIIMRKTTVSILLASAWLVPAVQIAATSVLNAYKKLCSFTLEGIFCNNASERLYCVLTKAQTVYSMVILSNVTVIPVFFILFTYTRIFVITYRSSREVKKKAAQTCLPHLMVLISFSCLCAYDVIVFFLEADISKVVRFIMTLQIVIYQPLFNPIIYGLKMKEISKHLKRLLCRLKIN